MSSTNNTVCFLSLLEKVYFFPLPFSFFIIAPCLLHQSLQSASAILLVSMSRYVNPQDIFFNPFRISVSCLSFIPKSCLNSLRSSKGTDFAFFSETTNTLPLPSYPFPFRSVVFAIICLIFCYSLPVLHFQSAPNNSTFAHSSPQLLIPSPHHLFAPSLLTLTSSPPPSSSAHTLIVFFPCPLDSSVPRYSKQRKKLCTE